MWCGYFWQDEGSCEVPPCPAGALGGDRVADLLRRLQRLRGVCAVDLQRHRIARRVEPLAAAIVVPPPLEMHALGVFLGEHIGVKLVIRRAGAMALEMRLAALMEFGLFA